MSILVSSESPQKPQGLSRVASVCSIPVGSWGLAWLRTSRNKQCLLQALLHGGVTQGSGNFLSWNLGQDSLLPHTGFRLLHGCTHQDAVVLHLPPGQHLGTREGQVEGGMEAGVEGWRDGGMKG